MKPAVEFVGQVLSIGLLVCFAAAAGYRNGRLDADKKWQRLLAEKNVLVLDVSTNYTTNFHGNFQWVK